MEGGTQTHESFLHVKGNSLKEMEILMRTSQLDELHLLRQTKRFILEVFDNKEEPLTRKGRRSRHQCN